MVTQSTSCLRDSLKNYSADYKQRLRKVYSFFDWRRETLANKEVNILIVVKKTRSMSVKGQLAFLLNRLGLAWWVEVTTQSPKCIYYFGPFASSQEAKEELPGYLEDLTLESAEGIQAVVKRCQPAELTIFDEPDRSVGQQQFSQQLP